MRRALALVTALELLVVMPATPQAAAPAAGCHAEWPVTAFRAGHGTTYRARLERVAVVCGVQIGYPTSETTLAVGSGGTVVFSPANSENTLARSVNGGRRWKLVGPTALQYTNLWNTVDPQVVLDRRTGRLFWVHTTYELGVQWPLPDQSPAAWLVPLAVADAHGFEVFSSTDGGRVWSTADYRRASTADWEKLFVGPPRPASTGAPRPRGYPDVVYVCANAPQEVLGPGRACYRSLDGGRTFQSVSFETPTPTSPAVCPPLAANTGVVASNGIVYIPQSCASGTYLAVSRDEGATFTWLRVPAAPATNGLGATVQLAIDSTDDLYLLWLSSGGQLELVRSRDGGRHWSAPLDVSPPKLHDVTLPALAAGARGHVGVVYYAAMRASAKRLTGYVSQTGDGLARRPLFYLGAVNNPAHPIFENYGQSDSPRADFIGAAFDGRGNLWGALVKQLGPPSSAGRIATTGYVGRLAFR